MKYLIKSEKKVYQEYLKLKNIFWYIRYKYFWHDIKILLNSNSKTVWSKIKEILNRKEKLENMYLGGLNSCHWSKVSGKLIQ